MAPLKTLLFALLSSSVGAQVFTLLYQQGLECTGTQVDSYEGPQQHGDHDVCLQIPSLGFTTAIAFSTEYSTEYRYTMRLHSDPDCQIGTNSFQAPASRPICVEVDGYDYVSVRAEPFLKRDTALEETVTTSNVAVRPNGDIGKSQTLRALIDCAIVQQTLQWVDMTFGSCGEIFTKETANEKEAAGAQCAWRAAVSAFYGILSVYEIRRLRTAPAGSPVKRADILAEILDVEKILPFDDDSLIPGLRTTVKFPEDGSHVLDEGRALTEAHWPLMEINTMSLTSGENQTSYVEKALFSDKAKVWSDGLVPASTSASSNSAKFARQKRQNQYTVYYASKDLRFEQWDQMDKSDAAIEDLAFTAWRFGYAGRSDKHCASLYFPDFNGVPQYFMAGYYGIVSGNFNENTDQCPAPTPFKKVKE